MQGATSQVQQKRNMLTQEGIVFDSQGIIAATQVMPAADLEQSYLNLRAIQ